MSDVHNHEHAKENKGVGPANSLRTVIGVIVSIIAVCLVMFAIFRVYSNELSDEFYDLASVSMDDYTAAQKVEVESFISEVSSVISTMCVLAESPDIDPSGSTFAACTRCLREGACLPIRSPMYVPASRTSEMWQRSCWASRTAT